MSFFFFFFFSWKFKILTQNKAWLSSVCIFNQLFFSGGSPRRCTIWQLCSSMLFHAGSLVNVKVLHRNTILLITRYVLESCYYDFLKSLLPSTPPYTCLLLVLLLLEAISLPGYREEWFQVLKDALLRITVWCLATLLPYSIIFSLCYFECTYIPQSHGLSAHF